MKRKWHRSNSEDSNTCSTSTSWSKLCESRSRWHNGEKPSEVFRTDLITAMKLHDSCHLGPEDYYVLADSWKQDWEKGVQVPVSPKSIPQAVVRTVGETSSTVLFKRPKKMIRLSSMDPSDLGYVGIRTLAEAMCRYDLDEQDVAWLQYANRELDGMGMQPVDENTMEKVMEEFERSCYDCLSQAMETEEGLGIEYDEDVVCDVCFSPHGEDHNEMVFCDKCNVCVHQACYGILKVPKGSWLCRICALGILPRCLLCPKRGGAMKSTRSGTKWTHVSCALWIPEVCIGNPESMEPITNISHIPNKRWSLSCCLCKDRSGACIQCSAKGCRVAFHVTCGQQASLKMSTVLTEADEVKFKSFCPQHSGLKTDEEEVDEEQQQRGKQSSLRTGRKNRETSSKPRAAVQKSAAEGVLSERKQRLQQLEDGFYRFVSPGNVAKHLGLPGETVDFVFQYWKLKRRVNFNRPLITPKREEEESLARREQEVLMRRLRLFTHLRQDLERVRNLAYMVTRREKIKRSVCRIQEQIFQQHTKMLEKDRFKGLSTTRRLSEALFYFRVPSSVPCSSPRPLKGHLTSNTPTEPPSPAPQTSLIPPEEPPDPGLKTEERKPDKAVLGGDVGAHRPSESFSPTPKTPKTNGILKGKTLRTNGLLQSQKAQDVKGVITAQVALKTERHSESERSVDMRRVTRGDSTKAATPKPQNFQDKGTVSNGSSTVSLGKYVRSGDLASGITHLSPNLVPTLCLTPVIVPPNMQSYSQLESKKRLKEPSSVQSKLRNGPRSSQDGLRTGERPISESMAKTTEMKAPAAAVTEDTKSNGGLRRSASSVSKLATGTEKDWGSFHIPKKRDLSGRAQPGGGLGGQLTLRQRMELPSCPRRTSDRTSLVIHSTPPTLRTRLRVSLENHVDNSVGNNQAHKDGQIKRCQTQRLRSQELMARRYGSDIIR